MMMLYPIYSEEIRRFYVIPNSTKILARKSIRNGGDIIITLNVIYSQMCDILPLFFYLSHFTVRVS